MKSNSTLLALGCLVLLTGCKSTGVDQSEETAQSMRDLKQALADAPAKITAVSASLEAIAKNGADMKAAFATFSQNVDTLIAHRDRVRSLRAQVDSNRDTFTQAWEKRTAGIEDASLKTRSLERRDAVLTKFDALKQTADAGKAEFEPWMKLVVDVRTYLENDLNPGGVASVDDKIKEISTTAASVNNKITTVVSGLDDMAKAIGAARPPEPEPKPDAKK
jgi:ABC-type transporter Mla subunit MlaD